MGAAGYYNHSSYSGSNPQNNTYDFWDNRQIDWSAYGQYSTDLFTARAKEIIQNSTAGEPWFLFLSYQAAHGPFEVPEHYVNTYCSTVYDRNRQIHCAMVAAMDKGIGQILDVLEAKGIMQDTLILFMSDNGGPVKNGYSSNYPLRGEKQGYWEGGTKSFTVFKGPWKMALKNVTYSGLFHAVDVLPTLAKAAGRSAYTRPSDLDGINSFWEIQKNEPSRREWMLYGVNDNKRMQAIRKGKWKLLGGSPGNKNGWYPSQQQQDEDGAVYVHMGKKAIADDAWHMYDLEVDPYERNNTYDAMLVADPDLVAEMKAEMQKYWDQMIPYEQAENI
nr:hypothetical protein BaRGS_023681 [Batillaria attramentaria]